MIFVVDRNNPNLIYTDVGVIPMYESNLDIDQFFTEMAKAKNGDGNTFVAKWIYEYSPSSFCFVNSLE